MALVAQDDEWGEEDWNDFNAARFLPVAEEELGLVLRLRERFSERVVASLVGEEREYIESLGAPEIDFGATPKGVRVLRLRFGGSEGMMEWDGSEAEAEQDIDSEAERLSYDAVYDYWVQGGGWEQWDSSGAPATDP